MSITSTTDTQQMPQEVVEFAPSPAKSKVERKKNIVGLRDMFDALLEKVKIPDSDFQMLQELQLDLERTCRLNEGELANTRVVLTGNWGLQLRPSPTATEMPIFFFSTENGIQELQENRPIFLDIISLMRVRKTIYEQDCFSSLEGGLSYVFQKTGLHFIIANNGTLMYDFHRRRLLQYYFNFEPRLKNLIGLINFWSNANNIVILETKTEYINPINKWVPEPRTLECLLVAFLCREKLVPSLRELQSMPHKLLLYTGRNIDVGFFDDPEFARSWSEKSTHVDREANGFILTVLELASNFFSFCSTLGDCSPCVVNIKGGEILPQTFFQPGDDENITKSSASSVEFSTVTPEEISSIGQLLFEEIGLKTNLEEQIILINPFNSKCYSSINRQHFQNKVCPIMKATSVKLKEFVNKWRNKSQNIEFCDLKDSLVCSTK